MSDKIAVITDRSGNVTTIDSGSAICVYAPEGSEWQICNKVEYSLPLSNPTLLRDALRNLILRLGDCKIVCGSSVVGLPFYVFEKMGFSVFEISELSDELLGSVLSDARDAELYSLSEDVYPCEPVETETSGHYSIDLIKLRGFRPEISSKTALRDFIKSARFRRLEVICSHVPIWIEEQIFPDRRFVCSAEQLGDDRFRVTVSAAMTYER